MRSIKRLRVVFTGAVLTAAAIAITVAMPGSAAPPTANSIDNPIKINVMGEWAHPDDDTSIIGPCGVWHQRYGVRCGIIQVTRGEGGGNAVGTEIGPALGLRRENEDRVAHYRSGTVDIFNLDKVDFFYNQSAPLTAVLLGPRRHAAPRHADHPHDAAGHLHRLHADARRRPRQPPAGRPLHLGGHARRGRPDDVPRPADGPARAAARGRSRRSSPAAATAGTGGTTTAADCTTGLRPTPARTSTPSRACGRATTRRTSGPPATSRASRPARRRSGRRSPPRAARAYPTQSRMMYKGTSAAGLLALRHDRATFVPFQPNVNPDGTANPLAGKDDAILYGAVDRRIRAGCPLGTLEYLTFDRFYNAPAQPFTATLHVQGAGAGRDPGRHGDADRAGRLDGRRGRSRSGRSRRRDRATVTLHRHAGRGAAVDHELQGLGARTRAARATGYTDNVVRVVAGRRGPLPALGQLGRVRPAGSRRRRRRRAASAARPRSSRWASARRSRSRSTSTTGRRRRRAAR